MSFSEELKKTIIVDMVGNDLRVINLPEGWSLDLSLMLGRIREDAKRLDEAWQKRFDAVTKLPIQEVKLSESPLHQPFDLHMGDMSWRGLTVEALEKLAEAERRHAGNNL